MKILLVEDSLVDANLMLSSLNKVGLSALSVSSGLEAWKTLLTDPKFDLLITDYVMPDMDGAELIKTVKGHKLTCDIPILIISGFIKLSEVNKLLDLGASRFQSKPIKVDEFRENVLALLNLGQPEFASH